MAETLQERLLRHEGLRLMPYRDTAGRLTIGVGRCLDTKGISREEAMQLLANDIADVTQQISQTLPWTQTLDAARCDVLREMAFQLGMHGLLAFANMLAALQSGDCATASKEMLDSDWRRQSPARCEELAGIMLNSTQG